MPSTAQRLADKAYDLWQDDRSHPSLEDSEFYDTSRGRHRKGSRSVSVSRRYRAIYVVDKDAQGRGVAVWYWIGSHEDYNNFVGS